MSAATPGQAAYEAYVMAAPDDLNFREPDKLADWEYPAWEAAAQAGYEQRAAQEPHAAPGLRHRVQAQVVIGNLVRHEDHDPSIACRPGGYGLCETWPPEQEPRATDEVVCPGLPKPAAGVDPASAAYRIEAHAFNAVTRALAPGMFVPLSERQAIAQAVVAAVEPIIRASEREHAAPEPKPAPELAAATAVLRRVLEWFPVTGTRNEASATRAQLARAYQDGRLTVPEELRRFL